jgi:hypothetical protein
LLKSPKLAHRSFAAKRFKRGRSRLSSQGATSGPCSVPPFLLQLVGGDHQETKGTKAGLRALGTTLRKLLLYPKEEGQDKFRMRGIG